ncbi:MAG: DUF4327 family protein [Cyanobacteriota bacterium]|nr:DUF4327 family protein [Cyanobacteriota bacterium]
MPTLSPTRYGVEAIQDEAKRLVHSGIVRRSEAIGHLQPFFPQREWAAIIEELEMQDYCSSDAICDLIGNCEDWQED